MIVSLKEGADPARVLGALAARGLWVGQVERAPSGAAIHYVIASHSAAASAADIAEIDGVSSVSTTKSASPLVEKQGPVAEVRGVRIAARSPKPTLMCGPCSGRVRGACPRHRGPARAPRRPVPSRRRLQAAHVSLRVPRPWRRGAGLAASRGGRARASRRDGGPRRGRCLARRRARRPHPGRVAQHAQLRVAQGHRAHRQARPLEAGMAATVDEWLQAGEYLRAGGSSSVIFCERGIRSFDGSTRNLLDLGAVALLAHVYQLPVIVDPSHGAGRRDLVLPLARAAIGAGAAGVMIETHDDPSRALSDGPQAIPLAELGSLLTAIHRGDAS